MLQRLNNIMCVNNLVKYYCLVVIEQSLDLFHELFSTNYIGRRL